MDLPETRYWSLAYCASTESLAPASPWLICRCFTPSVSWPPSWTVDGVIAPSPRRNVPFDGEIFIDCCFDNYIVRKIN